MYFTLNKKFVIYNISCKTFKLELKNNIQINIFIKKVLPYEKVINTIEKVDKSLQNYLLKENIMLNKLRTDC